MLLLELADLSCLLRQLVHGALEGGGCLLHLRLEHIMLLGLLGTCHRVGMLDCPLRDEPRAVLPREEPNERIELHVVEFHEGLELGIFDLVARCGRTSALERWWPT